MRDEYLSFRILVGLAMLVVSLVILAGILYVTWLPSEGMQFIGNVIEQVLHNAPLFGKWFNALSGLSRKVLTGIDSQQSALVLFSLMLECVTGNLLDAVLIGILSEGLRVFGGRSHPAARVIVASALGCILLYFLRKYLNESLAAVAQTVLSIGILLIGIGVMLRMHPVASVTRSVFNIILETFSAVAGVGMLCVLFFLPTAVATWNLDVIATWLLYLLLMGIFAFVTMLLADYVETSWPQ